jgi:hypothetical protein
MSSKSQIVTSILFPLPDLRLSIFSVFRKAVLRQCSIFLLTRAPRSRKSTASDLGEGQGDGAIWTTRANQYGVILRRSS